MQFNRLNISPAEFSSFKKHFSLNRCFYPGCTEKAIKAHSIQEKGPLKLISDYINSQASQVYYLNDELKFIPHIDAIGSLQKEKKELKHRGIGEASTFAGFCNKHDPIFKNTIEDVVFEGTNLQCFLHTYRANAHYIHSVSASKKGASTIMGMSVEEIGKSQRDLKSKIEQTEHEEAKDLLNNLTQIQDSVSELISGLKDVFDDGLNETDLARKKELDRMITSKSHDEIYYCVRSIEGVFPIASCEVIPYLSDKFLIKSEDGIAHSANYALTILPEKTSQKTHFIIGAIDENPNVELQINLFRNMSISKFLKFISNLLIHKGNNTFLSPRMINSMTDNDIKELIKGREIGSKQNGELGISSSTINLFDKEYLEFPH